MIEKETSYLLSFFLSICLSDALSTIGIDFGCDLAKVAIAKPSMPIDLVNEFLNNKVISTAIFINEDEIKFGWAAFNMMNSKPEYVYLHLPCLIGHRANDKRIERYINQFPYHKIFENTSTGALLIQNVKRNESYVIDELIALILDNLINIANRAIRITTYPIRFHEESAKEFENRAAVITIPSFFNQAERKIFLRICHLANITVLKLLDSNTAASLTIANKYLNQLSESEQYGILDIGAESISMTLFKFENNMSTFRGYQFDTMKITLLSSSFAKYSGINNIVSKLQAHFISEFKDSNFSTNFDLKNPLFNAKMYVACRKLFRRLLSSDETEVKILRLVSNIDYTISMNRTKFINLLNELYVKVLEVIQTAFRNAPDFWIIPKGLIVVGGGSNIPKLNIILKESLKKIKFLKVLDPFTDIAWGATYLACDLAPGLFNFPLQIHENHFKRIKIVYTAGKALIEKYLSFKILGKKQKSIQLFRDLKSNFNFSTFYFPNVIQSSPFHLPEKVNYVTVHSVLVSGLEETITYFNNSNTDYAVSCNNCTSYIYKGVRITHSIDENAIIYLESVQAIFVKRSQLNITENDFFADSLNDSHRIVYNNIQLEVIKRNLTFEIIPNSLFNVSNDDHSRALLRTNNYKLQIKEQTEKVNVKNELEFFLIETKKKFSEKDYIKCTTDLDRRLIWSFIEETERLFKVKNFKDISKQEYFERFDKILNLTALVDYRAHEMKYRPLLLIKLNQLLENTKHFIMNMFVTSQPGKSSKGLFTKNETKALRILNKEIKVWFKNVTKVFNQVKPNDDPPFTTYQIIEKIKTLETQHNHLLALMEKRIDPNANTENSRESLIENKSEDKSSCNSNEAATCPLKENDEMKPTIKFNEIGLTMNNFTLTYFIHNWLQQCPTKEIGKKLV